MKKQYDNLQYIMSRRIALTIIVNLLLAISAYCLILLISRPEEENDATSKLRLTCLLGVHILIFIWMFIIIKIQQLFSIVLSIFICLFAISVGLYLCEIKVELITRSHEYHYNHYSYHLQKLELTYLNIYFLVYMYSLIGLIPSGLFLISTEGLMCWQQHLINKYKDKCLKKVPFKQALKNQVCSICLGEFSADAGESLLQINNCGHIFHQKCLCQWIRYKTKCPMDRSEIFVYQEEDEEISQ